MGLLNRSLSLVFATRKHEYLAKEIAGRVSSMRLGKVARRNFPDGEKGYRFMAPIEDEHVVIVGGSFDDSEYIELKFLAAEAHRLGALSITIVIPCFRFQTQERASLPGEVVSADIAAKELSALPIAPLGNRILLFDLHKGEMIYYFHGDARAKHIHCEPIILEEIKKIAGENFVLGAVDSGRASWIEAFALKLGVKYALAAKYHDPNSDFTECTGILGDVAGKDVVIFDDMVRTGGSVIGAARAYLEARAKSITLVCTHGILPKKSLQKLIATGLFTRIVCSNSHPRGVELAKKNKELTVFSIGELITKAILGK